MTADTRAAKLVEDVLSGLVHTRKEFNRRVSEIVHSVMTIPILPPTFIRSVIFSMMRIFERETQFMRRCRFAR
jgi:hypothetical protein